MVRSMSRVLVVAAVGVLVGCGNASEPLHPMASEALLPSSDGVTVYDTANRVTWLADADLPATNTFGLPRCDGSGTQPCVNASGSMSYQSAVAWVAAMNAAHYLGHADWRLPTTPPTDTTCPKTGPHGNSFGFGCMGNALGSLYYTLLGLTPPNTAVPIPPNTVGYFSDFQPALYWSGTPGGQGGNSNGYTTFSFNTGFQGANTAGNFLYLLPMIPGAIIQPAAGTSLQLSPDGQTVYDPRADVTWLANANLAVVRTFGLPYCVSPTAPRNCINQQDGSMTWDAANAFVKRMNDSSYLGRTDWELPPSDPGCPNYGCAGTRNPMGELFYRQLGLGEGTPVVAAPDIAVGPFHNLQPYLYWACEGQAPEAKCHPGGPAPNFEWSFSFGNGFQGTNLLADELYVTAYFPGPPTPLPVN
jgi:hypothetical protein